MFDGLQFRIRWRWLFAGIAVVAVASCVVWAIHSFQINRIAGRLLANAQTASAAGELAKARNGYSAYIELVNDDGQALLEYADVIQRSGETIANDNLALNLLDQAMQHGVDGPDIRAQTLKLATRLKRYSAALTIANGMDLDTSDSDPELLALRGTCHLQKGEFDLAEEDFRRALTMDGDCTTAWSGLTELKRQSEGINAALAIAEEMQTVSPGANAWSIQARLLQQSNNLQKAGTAFLTAAKLNDNDFESARELAEFVMYHVPPNDEMDMEMIRCAYDLLKKNHTQLDYTTVAQLADLAHRLQDTSAALKHYQQCMEIRPRDAFAIGRSAEILIDTQQFRQAHELLDSLPNTKSQKLLSHVLRARVFQAQKETDQAVKLLDEVVQTGGDSHLREGAFFLLVDCLWQLNQNERAVQCAKDLMSVTANADSSRALLIETLIRSADYEEAITQLQLLRYPEKQLGDLVVQLIQMARSQKDETRLNKHLDNARLLRTAGAIPVIIDAYRWSMDGKLDVAANLLARGTIQHPQANEHWNALKDIRSRAISRHLNSGELLESAGDIDRESRILQCIAHARGGDVDQLQQSLKAKLREGSDRVETVRWISDVIDRLAADSGTTELSVNLFNAIAADLTKVLQIHTTDVSGDLARILRACGHRKEAIDLLLRSLSIDSQAPFLIQLCDIAADSSDAAAAMLQQILQSKSLGADSPVGRAIQAEIKAIQSTPTEASEELAKWQATQPQAEAVGAMRLRLSAYSGKRSRSLADTGRLLSSKYPHCADMLLLESSGLSAEGRYLESLDRLAQAFSMNQHPRYLLHAAHTYWLMDRPEQAATLLKIADDAGLHSASLSELDKRLLDSLTASPDVRDHMPETHLTQAVSPGLQPSL